MALARALCSAAAAAACSTGSAATGLDKHLKLEPGGRDVHFPLPPASAFRVNVAGSAAESLAS